MMWTVANMSLMVNVLWGIFMGVKKKKFINYINDSLSYSFNLLDMDISCCKVNKI
jgi:hypothetical protein